MRGVIYIMIVVFFFSCKEKAEELESQLVGVETKNMRFYGSVNDTSKLIITYELTQVEEVPCDCDGPCISINKCYEDKEIYRVIVDSVTVNAGAYDHTIDLTNSSIIAPSKEGEKYFLYIQKYNTDAYDYSDFRSERYCDWDCEGTVEGYQAHEFGSHGIQKDF